MKTIRLNFEFPRSVYPYLKMLCAEKGISLKEFATDVILRALEEYEDHSLAKKARKRIKKMNPKDNVPFGEASQLAK